ncbi:MAG: GGDEF domain-containing protein [Alphaproteobacteria bacterium]
MTPPPSLQAATPSSLPAPARPVNHILDWLARAADGPTIDLDSELAALAHQIIQTQQARIAYLETLSNTDETTGIFNRRGFTQQLDRQLAAAQRYGETGVVGLCDLDQFKAINDRFGHPAGDRALRFVADILVAATRRTDVVARIGGDEFAIILANTSAPHGRARIASIDRWLATSPLDIDGITLRLGASFGITTYRAGMNADDIIRHADQAMYEAKRHARSRGNVIPLASARAL